MMNSKDIISRRGDLSTFVVHLTREFNGQSGKDNLKQMVKDGQIKAVNAYGCAVERFKESGLDQNSFPSQRVVCFTETPLEYIHLFLEEVEREKLKFEPYGFAFTKMLARRRGVNPVWYLDITPKHDWLTIPWQLMIKEILDRDPSEFEASNIARLTPFIEQMGTHIDNGKIKYRKEFWWEREWRFVGDFSLPKSFIGLCREEEILEFEKFASDEKYFVKFIDPRWGLEKIIAHLAGFAKDETDIF